MAPPFLIALQRRRAVRALIGYAIAAFAALQIVEPVMHGLHWPDAVLSYLVVGLAAGLPLVVAVAWIFDVSAQEPASPADGLRGKRLALLVAGLALAAITLGAGKLLMRHSAGPPAAGVRPSIAVLPFADLSPQKDQEYFSDGLAEEILDALTQVEGLRVAGRTSSFSFRGKQEDLREIGRKLNVSSVLEGSVRKAGDRVRITAQLVGADDGFHLWSQTFDRQVTDVFAVQDEIARAVVTALRVKLLPGQQLAAGERRTADADAYTHYLLGRRALDRGSPESSAVAMRELQSALERDPGFAPAWATLSQAIFLAEIVSGDAASADVPAARSKAMEAANRAIALAPQLSDAWSARGYLRTTLTQEWQGAEADFERALALNPGNAEVLRQQAMLRSHFGQSPEAIAIARRATALDPLSSLAFWSLGNIQLRAGQLEAAEAALARSIEISPEQDRAHRDLGYLELVRGKPQEALLHFARAKDELWRFVGAALAQHDLGNRKEAEEALRRVIARYSGADYQVAQIYAWWKEPDLAFEWLERSWKVRDPGLNYLKLDPLLRSLHDDARWRPLVREIGLPLD